MQMERKEAVPSFTYTGRGELWQERIFLPLLLRHGSPPRGIKWYGKAKRLHVRSPEGQKWINNIVADCEIAVHSSSLLSHYKQNYRQMLAKKIKNSFIRWCRDNRQ